MDSLPNHATFVGDPGGDAEGGDGLRMPRLYKTFGQSIAVDYIDLAVAHSALFGLV